MLALSTEVKCDDNTYDVTKYGAVSDGTTDNTRVFHKFEWLPKI